MEDQIITELVMTTKLPPYTPTVAEATVGTVLICELHDGSLIVIANDYDGEIEYQSHMSWEHYQNHSDTEQEEYQNVTDQMLGIIVVQNVPEIYAVYIGDL